MLRVNQAGEYGAKCIYAGQMAVIGSRHPAGMQIAEMAAQEQRHLDGFNAMMAERGVRPTLLQPLWHVAGYALGAATALIGPKAAMACTVAVETEIDRHYAAQLVSLRENDPQLADAVRDYQADEQQHKQTALDAGAEQAVGYPLLSGIIRAGCRAAIAIAARI